MAAETELIISVVIVLVCAVIITFIGRKLRIPLIIGYFITGIIVGPSGLGLITGAQVDLLAELGVILLMFTIGLEVSLKNLLSMKRIVLIGGGIQVCLMTAAIWALLHLLLGLASNTAFLLGMMIATSSTAIVLSIYQKSGDVDKQHGKIALGILIFQDLAVIPMMLICPLLSGGNMDIVSSLKDLFIGLGMLALVLIAGVYIVPIILQKVAFTRSSELFILSVVVICFGIAWLMSLVGISLALGAFLAGIAISESDYCHEVIGQVMPLRDILTSFFFVSIGMMLNLKFFFEYIGPILLLALGVIVVKFLLNFASIKAIGNVTTGTAILAGLGLAQIGEFSFVLGEQGFSVGILPDTVYQFFLGVAILTMMVTPFLIHIAPKFISKVFTSETLPKTPAKGEDADTVSHVIIVGYGLAGRYVARALKKVNIPYVILELNPDTVARERRNGENIVYGDASHEAVLEYADIKHAQTLVISVPNMDAVKAIITLARRMNPKVGIITRSRFIAETPGLYRLGADEVIVDEREAAIQVFKRILSNEQVPLQDIEQYVQQLRNEMYNKYIETPIKSHLKRDERSGVLNSIMLRARRSEDMAASQNSFVEQIRVEEGCSAADKKLSDVHLRANYGVSVIAVRRANADAIVSPDGETVLNAGDMVVVIGERGAIHKIAPLFLSPATEAGTAGN